MKNIILISLFFVINSFCFSQSLRLVTNLPSHLSENSGLVATSSNGIWTHNDSGDGPIIYKIDSNGNQLDSINLNGVLAIDFEDIAKDNQGNFYIGDIGNNNHNRTDLVIYKIPNPDSILGNNVTPEAIYFSYPNQVIFPDPNQNKDCEALFHFNGHIYLLSKNWGNSGYSTLYQLPDSGGTYIATIIDSVQTPLVTGADFHSSGKLAILSMDRVVIFDQFIGNNFFNGRKSTFPFSLTQKEGVSFVNANSLYVSQENNRFFPGAKLYQLNFASFLSLVSTERAPDITAIPNPTSERLQISIKEIKTKSTSLSYEIYNTKGQLVASKEFDFSPEFTVFLSNLEPGIYFFKLIMDNHSITKRIIKN
jgi:hypothetical protein